MSKYTPNWLRADMVEMGRHAKVCNIFHHLYEGNVEERFSNITIRDDLAGTDFYQINLARSAVDAPLERTNISGIQCADEKARTTLEDFWSLNELEFDSHSIHEKAFEFGSAMIIALPDEDGLMQAYAHDPANVMVFYDPARPRVKSHAVQMYTKYGLSADDEDYDVLTTDDLYLYVVVYDRFVIQTYVSTTPVSNGIDLQTVDLRLLDEVNSPVPGVVPVFHFRTARTPHGRSRLVDAAGPQMAVNDTVTALMASIKAAGYRQRYLLMEQQQGGNDAFTPSVNSNGGAVNQEYQAGPDTIFLFKGASAAGTFEVTESKNFLEAIDALAGYMAQVTDTPRHYFTSGADAPSGESYRMGERPLMAVVKHAQALFAATWSELFDYVLSYYGVPVVDNKVVFESIGNDDKDYWETQTIKADLGYPLAALLVEAGVPQETVDEWMADRKGIEAGVKTKVVVDESNVDEVLAGATPDGVITSGD